MLSKIKIYLKLKIIFKKRLGKPFLLTEHSHTAHKKEVPLIKEFITKFIFKKAGTSLRHYFIQVKRERMQEKMEESTWPDFPMQLFVQQTCSECLLGKQPQGRHYATQGKQ